MPLPVIFKFISDTSEAKFDKVVGEMDGVKIGSERAGRAVKNLATIFRDGQDPAIALADAMGNLTKAFGLGVGATVAVVGVVEVIKTFIKNADEMNKATDSMNKALTNFRQNSETLDLKGALTQIRSLTAELENAKKAAQTRPEDKFFTTIADAFFGGARIKNEAAQGGTRQAIQSAKLIAEQSILEEGRLQILKYTNELEYERVQIQEKYAKKQKEIAQFGLDELVTRDLEMQKAIELEQVEVKAAKKRQDAVQKEADEKKKSEEERKKAEAQLDKIRLEAHQRALKRIEDERKAVAQFYREGFEGAGTLLDRVKEAAQRRGRDDIVRRIDRERANLQVATDTLLLDQLRQPGKGREFDFMTGRQIERERISGFAQMEANTIRESNRMLFGKVDAVRAVASSILASINARLGVPILRSAR